MMSAANNKDLEVTICYEEGADHHLGIRYHPVAPLVCFIKDQKSVTVRNYETSRCVAMFDIFSGQSEPTEKREGKPFQCFEALFIDKLSIMWNAESCTVASGIAARINSGIEMSRLFLFDRYTLIKWNYLEEQSEVFDIQAENKSSAFRAILYDENHVVIGYEDGAIKLFNFETNTWTATLTGGHKTAIIHLSILLTDPGAKPYVLSAELAGHIVSWNIDSKTAAMKFSEMIKGKSTLVAFKKDQIKGICFNKYYKVFLVVTGTSIVLFNVIGNKMLSVNLYHTGMPLAIKSVMQTAAFRYSLTQYIASSEGRLYTFDLVDGANIHPEIQSRMLIATKNVAEFNLEVTELPDLQRDLTFERSIFNTNLMRSKTTTSACILKASTVFSDHIKSHPLYFSRTPSVLIKEHLDNFGRIKAISSKDLDIIKKAETAEFGVGDSNKNFAAAPKSVFLHVHSNLITSNIIEFLSEDTGKLDNLTYTSVLYANNYTYSHVKVELCFNGLYFAVIELGLQRAQIFCIHNNNLKSPGDEEPGARFLHPLGAIEKIYEMACKDVCWKEDSLEFCALVYELKRGPAAGQIVIDFEVVKRSDCKPVACIFAIKKDENIVFPLKKIE